MVSIIRIADLLFDDKRVGICFLMCWLAFVMSVFGSLGLLHEHYMSFGPSPETLFMRSVIDTWYKWGMVAGFTAINTCINDFMSDAISPWILNTITDHKTRYLPYNKLQCLLIVQCWTLYCGIMGVVGVMIILSQADFVLIRLLCDLFISLYTNYKFMTNKLHDPRKYFEMQQTSHDENSTLVTRENAREVTHVIEDESETST